MKPDEMTYTSSGSLKAEGWADAIRQYQSQKSLLKSIQNQ